MTGSPLPVSVVIPAFNRAAMIGRAVRSALEQQPHPPAEVIVVDDCSTDATARAAEQAGARVLRHDANRGPAAARNTGIAAATQPWIGLLDSDDEWLAHLLAVLWPLRQSHVLVAGSAMHRNPGARPDRYAGPVRRRPRVLRSPAALIYPENFLPASGVLVSASAVRAVGGYDPAIAKAEDLDLWLRLLERGTGVVSPTVVVEYHVHSDQLTQDREAMARSQLALLRSYRGRSWWSGWRVEAWRGGAAWDELRRRLGAGDPGGALRAAAIIARHPIRVAGLIGVLVRRYSMRRRTAELEGHIAPRSERPPA